MRGSVAKKRDRWYIYYYVGKDENGKWKRKWEGSWSTRREAEKMLRSRIQELENTFERKAADSSVEQYLNHWLEVYCKPKLAANTVRGYTVNVEKHIVPHIGQIRLNKLLPRDIQKLYSDLAAEGLSGTSVRYVHNNLHKALAQAVKLELIGRNPADLVEPPRVDRYDANTLKPDELVTLLKAARGREIYLPVLLASCLGLRRGEALGLRWEDVDTDAGTLTVRHSASFRDGQFILSATKTKKSRRTLLLPDIITNELKATLTRQEEARKRIGEDYNSFGLVCCRLDGSPMTPNALNHLFHDLLVEAGLPSIRFHDLRHTNATLMLRSAVPAKIVSSMLGHSSIGITMDIYSHVITEMQEGATGVINGLLKNLW